MSDPDWAPPEIVEPEVADVVLMPGTLQQPDGNSALLLTTALRLNKQHVFDAFDMAGITDEDVRKMATVATYVMINDITSGRLVAKDANEAAGIAAKLAKIAQGFATDYEKSHVIDASSRAARLVELSGKAKGRKQK